MAHVRDSDTSLWLHNKLGSSNDLWVGGSICSQLNQDVLRNIRECFIELQSQVKLKLLLSFLHIPRRNVEEWKVELEEILEVALVDSDQWVSMLAELLKSFPSTGSLNFQIEENSSVFTDVVNDLKKTVRKYSDQGMLPLECLYLNRNALTAVVGPLPQPTKHFTLKQKPKSATLRAELLQKSLDAASNLKRSTTVPSVPIRCRGLIKPINDAAPLKGIPSRLNSGGFKPRSNPLSRLNSASTNRVLARTPGRKDGGIKLLEIDEQPFGCGRDSKRRKKASEEVLESRKEKEIGTAVCGNSGTPDYAAGLLSSSQLSGTSISVISQASKNYPQSTAVNSMPSSIGNSSSVSGTVLPAVISKSQENVPPSTTVVVTPETSQIVSHMITSNQNHDQPSTVIHTTTIGTLASLGGSSIQMQQHTAVPQLIQNQILQSQSNLQNNTTTTAQIQNPSQKKLLLTKEQMQEAQEMFNKSNKVTRPEKALILGFIAGSRDNPCPHLGQIVTIMLSENEEKVHQIDGSVQTMIVETHFQMNYSTGEWKRVKKYRRMEP